MIDYFSGTNLLVLVICWTQFFDICVSFFLNGCVFFWKYKLVSLVVQNIVKVELERFYLAIQDGRRFNETL